MVIVGSAWKEIRIIKDIFLQCAENTYFIIAPHEIDAQKIAQEIQYFPEQSIRFSDGKAHHSLLKNRKILWINNIGLLTVYIIVRHCFCRRGFNGELHNILQSHACLEI